MPPGSDQQCAGKSDHLRVLSPSSGEREGHRRGHGCDQKEGREQAQGRESTRLRAARLPSPQDPDCQDTGREEDRRDPGNVKRASQIPGSILDVAGNPARAPRGGEHVA